MELRNSYVHYKWKPENEQLTREGEAMVKDIEKTLGYIRCFEAKICPLLRVER